MQHRNGVRAIGLNPAENDADATGKQNDRNKLGKDSRQPADLQRLGCCLRCTPFFTCGAYNRFL